MSHLIQIAKKTTDSLSVLKTGDTKNAPSFSQEISTIDMLGLSWIFKDEDVLEDLK
ncbi:hypothetical protein [Nitrosopumilus sp. b2]|uniref:hypothetical protein n=1 Tax=Nitrosopumilus sp. b2 TaxID=2109908 RepID=UPI0015F47EB7|nr:hypothetical protein [Nitrosopumilus sp. b2]